MVFIINTNQHLPAPQKGQADALSSDHSPPDTACGTEMGERLTSRRVGCVPSDNFTVETHPGNQ